MSQLVPILLLICGVTVGITMAIWFNCSVHKEIQRRIGIKPIITPIVEAEQITGELPVGTVLIVVNND